MTKYQIMFNGVVEHKVFHDPATNGPAIFTQALANHQIMEYPETLLLTAVLQKNPPGVLCSVVYRDEEPMQIQVDAVSVAKSSLTIQEFVKKIFRKL